MEYVTLSNEVKMPILGYGVYQISKEEPEGNFNIFDFSLSDEDMTVIAGMDKNESYFFSHRDPKIVEWFVNMVEERRKRRDASK